MGGYNSGRWFYYDSKATTNSYLCIDIRQWKRKKLLTQNNSFISRWKYNEMTTSIQVDVASNLENVIINHHSRNNLEKQKSISYKVQIEWTACNLGGQRPWFICPLKVCGKKVAILYGGNVFACRNCYNLVYQCQRETIGDRASRQADKIRDKLKWMPGILNGEELKPKRMHWKTFNRLKDKHNYLVYIALLEAQARFGININEFI